MIQVLFIWKNDLIQPQNVTFLQLKMKTIPNRTAKCILTKPNFCTITKLDNNKTNIVGLIFTD